MSKILIVKGDAWKQFQILQKIALMCDVVICVSDPFYEFYTQQLISKNSADNVCSQGVQEIYKSMVGNYPDYDKLNESRVVIDELNVLRNLIPERLIVNEIDRVKSNGTINVIINVPDNFKLESQYALVIDIESVKILSYSNGEFRLGVSI